RTFLRRGRAHRHLLPTRLPRAPGKVDQRPVFPSAAAAEAAGVRPCLRGRPETAPFSNAWIGSRATVERAGRLIVEEGALDGEGASVGKTSQRLRMGRPPPP